MLNFSAENLELRTVGEFHLMDDPTIFQTYLVNK